MAFETSQHSFAIKNRITEQEWADANISWDTLRAIAEHHLSKRMELTETASLCARVMQTLRKVHSVRWRVKDVEHLLAKIVRKRATAKEGSKYLEITPDNYHEIVTDLVGLRALHLFKDDCFSIDDEIRNAFTPLEGEEPVAYYRLGDPQELLDRFKQARLRVEEHKAGYRSIHYVVASQPLQRRIGVEIQVRTIFEEGWSEIDHEIRYPNFSDDPQIALFLRIFSGLSGSADQMGSFVRDLVDSTKAYRHQIEQAARNHEDTQRQIVEATANYEVTLRKLEATVAELGKAKETGKAASEKLKGEIAELRIALARAELLRSQPHASWPSTSTSNHVLAINGDSYGLGLPSLNAGAPGYVSPLVIGSNVSSLGETWNSLRVVNAGLPSSSVLDLDNVPKKK